MMRTEKESKVLHRNFGESVPHGAVAEIFIDQTGKHAVGMLANVGRLGCFVRTRVPIPDGAKVKLKVSHGESVFEIVGEVTYRVPWKGVGIKFSEARPEFGVEAEEDAQVSDASG